MKPFNEIFGKSKNSIKRAIYLPLFIVFVSTAIILRVGFLEKKVEQEINFTQKLVKDSLTILGEGLVPLILDSQLSNIYETLDRLKASNVEWKVVLLKNASNQSLYPLEVPEIPIVSKSLRRIDIPITVDNQLISTLTVFYDFHIIYDNITYQYNIIFALILFSIIVSLLILSSILETRIIKPIIKLSYASTRLSFGDLNFNYKKMIGDDEMSKLFNNFLIMKDEVKKYRTSIKRSNHDLQIAKRELEDINLNLEKKVEKKSQELALSRANNEHAERLAALGELASGIAHEINNPVTVMEGQIRRLKDFVHDEDITLDKKEQLITKIHKNLNRVVSIVNGIRKISRNSETDKLRIIKTEELTNSLADLVKEKYRGENIDFEIIDEENSSVYAKEAQTLQILFNLVSNSFDAISELEERWIRITVERNSENIVFRVIDSGGGIEDSILEKIFNPFYTTKDIGTGTGIGLSISKKLSEEQNGSLKYELYENNTSFCLNLKSA